MRSLGLLFLIIISNPLFAACLIDRSFGSATHFLVNGLVNKPVPEIIFNVPYNQVGNQQALESSNVLNNGGNNTLPNHVRFRLRVKNKSSDHVKFLIDSSSPLSCINCAEAITIPFSSFSWVEGNARETTGKSPSANHFNDNELPSFTANKGSENIFNLKFSFDNSEILPAGTYEGEFKTIGRPQ